MFGVGGVLSSPGDGGKGMGKYVKELELDRLDVQDSGELEPSLLSFLSDLLTSPSEQELAPSSS